MQSGASEGSFPVMVGLKWIKTYPAIMNTPLSVADLLLGLLSWIAVRLFMICGIFAAILVLFDAADPGNAVLAVFPAVLTGLAFAAPMAAFASWLEDDTGLTMVFRFGIVPLFLFSGTFFPIEQLPDFLEGLAYATPLFHGVELTRSIALGIESALPTWQHITYLLTVLVIGALLAHHYLSKEATDMTTLLTRVAPPAVRPTYRVRHLLEHNVIVYRSVWWVILAGFFEPVFYLFSIGIGLGKLVGDVPGPTGEMVTYAAFVAPAMLAASAMNGAVYESTFNIFFKIRYGNTYKAILATPIGPGDIATGEIVWSLFRGALYASGFIIVMAFMGLIDSPWGVLALPATLLIGFAFGAVGMAATTFMRSWQDFDLVNMVTLPLFLFSADVLPARRVPGILPALHPALAAVSRDRTGPQPHAGGIRFGPVGQHRGARRDGTGRVGGNRQTAGTLAAVVATTRRTT